jgi:hypothetical protein
VVTMNLHDFNMMAGNLVVGGIATAQLSKIWLPMGRVNPIRNSTNAQDIRPMEPRVALDSKKNWELVRAAYKSKKTWKWLCRWLPHRSHRLMSPTRTGPVTGLVLPVKCYHQLLRRHKWKDIP